MDTLHNPRILIKLELSNLHGMASTNITPMSVATILVQIKLLEYTGRILRFVPTQFTSTAELSDATIETRVHTDQTVGEGKSGDDKQNGERHKKAPQAMK